MTPVPVPPGPDGPPQPARALADTEPPFADPFHIDASALIAGAAALRSAFTLPEWMTRPSLAEVAEEIRAARAR